MNALFNTLRNRLLIVFVAASLAVGVPSYLYLSGLFSERLVEQQQGILNGLARSVSTLMQTDLAERQRQIYLLSQLPSIKNPELFDRAALRAFLDKVKGRGPITSSRPCSRFCRSTPAPRC